MSAREALGATAIWQLTDVGGGLILSSTAALCGPLREKLSGKRVALIVCGANLDAQTFAALLTS